MHKQLLTVVKIGGKVLEQEESLKELLENFAQMQGNKLLVHGGGKEATDLALRLGVEATMVQGRRITDGPMLEIAVMVYAGLANKRIVSHLQAMQINALGLTGADLDIIRAKKRKVVEIDYGFVGDIDRINVQKLEELLTQAITPVIAPITHDGAGQLLNTNADTVASCVAVHMSGKYKVRLVYIFEKAGVLSDPTDNGTVIPHIHPELYLAYKNQGIISGGMIPKLDNSFEALSQGVQGVYLCLPQALPYLNTPLFSGTYISL